MTISGCGVLALITFEALEVGIWKARRIIDRKDKKEVWKRNGNGVSRRIVLQRKDVD